MCFLTMMRCTGLGQGPESWSFPAESSDHRVVHLLTECCPGAQWRHSHSIPAAFQAEKFIQPEKSENLTVGLSLE